jgi:hypothetical protein
MRSSQRLCVFMLIIVASGCSASKPRVTTPAVDLSSRLSEADALVAAGCYDCLRGALERYQALRKTAAAPAPSVERATAGAFRAAALLAVR